MKHSYCPNCGEIQIKEVRIREAVYGYDGTSDEPKLLKPAVLRCYCPDCMWKEEYDEEQ